MNVLTKAPELVEPYQLGYQHNYGGRDTAGYKDLQVGDCGVRACAIATGEDYKTVVSAFKDLVKEGIYSSNSTQTGLVTSDVDKFLKNHGFVYEKVKDGYLNMLPKTGTFVAYVSNHYVTVIDGVVNDTYPSHEKGVSKKTGQRKLYGFWYKASEMAIYPNIEPLAVPVGGGDAEWKHYLTTANNRLVQSAYELCVAVYQFKKHCNKKAGGSYFTEKATQWLGYKKSQVNEMAKIGGDTKLSAIAESSDLPKAKKVLALLASLSDADFNKVKEADALNSTVKEIKTVVASDPVVIDVTPEPVVVDVTPEPVVTDAEVTYVDTTHSKEDALERLTLGFLKMIDSQSEVTKSQQEQLGLFSEIISEEKSLGKKLAMLEFLSDALSNTLDELKRINTDYGAETFKARYVELVDMDDIEEE